MEKKFWFVDGAMCSLICSFLLFISVTAYVCVYSVGICVLVEVCGCTCVNVCAVAIGVLA